jgi:ABC-type nitrate/sulfonate/bicarbonate transport system permease component
MRHKEEQIVYSARGMSETTAAGDTRLGAQGAPGTGYRVILPRVRRKRSPLGRWYRRNERNVLGILGLVSFFTFWQLGSIAGFIPQLFFSSPTEIVRAAAAEVQVPRFWEDVRYSLSEVTIGFIASLVLAVPLGLAIGWYRRVSYTFDPWLNFFNAIPRPALIPLVVLWVGLGIEMKIIIVFLGGFFSILLPTVEGVRTVEPQLLDVARSFRASSRRLFTSLVIPATVPFIATGVRLALGRLLIGVVVAELYAQTQGLGVMIDKSAESLQSDRMLFGILLFTLMGVITTEAAVRVERRLQRWRPSLNIEEGN